MSKKLNKSSHSKQVVVAVRKCYKKPESRFARKKVRNFNNSKLPFARRTYEDYDKKTFARKTYGGNDKKTFVRRTYEGNYKTTYETNIKKNYYNSKTNRFVKEVDMKKVMYIKNCILAYEKCRNIQWYDSNYNISRHFDKHKKELPDIWSCKDDYKTSAINELIKFAKYNKTNIITQEYDSYSIINNYKECSIRVIFDKKVGCIKIKTQYVKRRR